MVKPDFPGLNDFFLLPIPVRLTRGNVYCFKWHELLLVMTLWIKSFEPGPGIDSMAIALFPTAANSTGTLNALAPGLSKPWA